MNSFHFHPQLEALDERIVPDAAPIAAMTTSATVGQPADQVATLAVALQTNLDQLSKLDQPAVLFEPGAINLDQIGQNAAALTQSTVLISAAAPRPTNAELDAKLAKLATDLADTTSRLNEKLLDVARLAKSYEAAKANAKAAEQTYGAELAKLDGIKDKTSAAYTAQLAVVQAAKEQLAVANALLKREGDAYAEAYQRAKQLGAQGAAILQEYANTLIQRYAGQPAGNP